jgi:hypothetical protein
VESTSEKLGEMVKIVGTHERKLEERKYLRGHHVRRQLMFGEIEKMQKRICRSFS